MLELVGAATEVVPVSSLEKAIGLRVQLRFNILVLLDVLLLVRDLLLREGVTMLLLLGKLVLATVAQLCHTVLVRVAGWILDAHLRSLAIFGHGLRVLETLVAQLQDSCLLRSTETGGLGTVDSAWHELISFP